MVMLLIVSSEFVRTRSRMFPLIWVDCVLVEIDFNQKSDHKELLKKMCLNLGIHTQFDSGSNMGWVSPGHTFFFHCVRLKMSKMVLLKLNLDLGS